MQKAWQSLALCRLTPWLGYILIQMIYSQKSEEAYSNYKKTKTCPGSQREKNMKITCQLNDGPMLRMGMEKLVKSAKCGAHMYQICDHATQRQDSNLWVRRLEVLNLRTSRGPWRHQVVPRPPLRIHEFHLQTSLEPLPRHEQKNWPCLLSLDLLGDPFSYVVAGC